MYLEAVPSSTYLEVGEGSSEKESVGPVSLDQTESSGCTSMLDRVSTEPEYCEDGRCVPDRAVVRTLKLDCQPQA